MSIADDLLTRFRWVDGHADVWRLFVDHGFFARMIAALADPFRDGAITKVAGIEARGFIVGAAVAGELNAGFVAIRKEGGSFPGEKLTQATPPDYRGNATTLRLQRSSLTPHERVLLVDDWFETGSQALTAKSLVEAAGAVFVGASVIVDQLEPEIDRSWVSSLRSSAATLWAQAPESLSHRSEARSGSAGRASSRPNSAGDGARRAPAPLLRE